MRKKALIAGAIAGTLAAAVVLAMVVSRPDRPPAGAPQATGSASAIEPSAEAEPSASQVPAMREIVLSPIRIEARLPRRARPTHLPKCSDWKDLAQGPVTSKVRRCE